MREKFLKITNAAYKVIDFFPESDPLKIRAKDKALTIMENLTLISGTSGWASLQKEKAKTQAIEDINVLLGYFWIAKSQGWLSAVNCLIISNEYEKIKKEIEPVQELTQELPGLGKLIFKEATQEKEISQNPPSAKLTARQEKILDFLTKNEKAQVMDLKKILPDVTKRTIRRDLDELLQGGKIERLGEFNQVVYRIKGV